ncbi:hypothetical protein JW710_05015 [Candidatus Dojkabacteria bacterium]|nr:hypothetical protein [Candidatus Dojkabacteria bacterium]
MVKTMLQNPRRLIIIMLIMIVAATTLIVILFSSSNVDLDWLLRPPEQPPDESRKWSEADKKALDAFLGGGATEIEAAVAAQIVREWETGQIEDIPEDAQQLLEDVQKKLQDQGGQEGGGPSE